MRLARSTKRSALTSDFEIGPTSLSRQSVGSRHFTTAAPSCRIGSLIQIK